MSDRMKIENLIPEGEDFKEKVWYALDVDPCEQALDKHIRETMNELLDSLDQWKDQKQGFCKKCGREE